MTAEERVVSRHARVVKEVVDSKDVEECTETVRDTGRRTEVDVEPVRQRRRRRRATKPRPSAAPRPGGPGAALPRMAPAVRHGLWVFPPAPAGDDGAGD